MKCPAGITAISLFFCFGTAMSGLAAVLLAFPGSPLDPLWRLNPRAHEYLISAGRPAILLMIVVCGACAVAAVGLWRCARWGYRTALTILSINVVADAANAFLIHDLRTLLGVPIGAAIIFYLVTQRTIFEREIQKQ